MKKVGKEIEKNIINTNLGKIYAVIKVLQLIRKTLVFEEYYKRHIW